MEFENPEVALEAVTPQSLAVFDVDRPMLVRLSPEEGAKKVFVRFPTDAEWADRQRKRKIVVKQLGRGNSKMDSQDSCEEDLVLFEKIRQPLILAGVEISPEIDEYEAATVIEKIGYAEVRADDFEVVQGGFVVHLRVPGGVTVHHLKTPSAKEVFRYKRDSSVSISGPRGVQIIKVNLDAGGDLYNGMVSRTEGYSLDNSGRDKIPVTHRMVVAQHVIDEIGRAFSEDAGEDF